MDYHGYRAGNDTLVGVVSCSASFTQTGLLLSTHFDMNREGSTLSLFSAQQRGGNSSPFFFCSF